MLNESFGFRTRDSEWCLNIGSYLSSGTLGNSSISMIYEISQFNVYMMSILNIPGIFRPEGCRNLLMVHDILNKIEHSYDIK